MYNDNCNLYVVIDGKWVMTAYTYVDSDAAEKAARDYYFGQQVAIELPGGAFRQIKW